ncbi:MAG TPA: isoprenylcysteine carboxylmethyltransferase family protein, partial [Luteitalea sp.]|nr:isoprenylcysteine carboxylmethyltransferase family protein [Luteitalea sp.]
ARRSAANEARLFAAGAVLVDDPSYPAMRVAYPLGFVLLCLEGWWRGADWDAWAVAGVVVVIAAKTIKYAAIATLGERWSYRVVVLPGAPLVATGLYRYVRHPNYVGVAGEILGTALWLRAPIAGTLFAVTFGWILVRRINVEERALGLAPRA